MQNYILIYAKPAMGKGNRVLVVLKNRPEWQNGYLNLVGGKIEAGESPEEAAIRELKEESGLDPLTEPRIMGHLKGSWGIVYCIKIAVSHKKDLKPDPSESELVCWMDWNEIKNHELLIPNIRVILPLMLSGITGWTVTDEGPDWKSDNHTVAVTVASHDKSKGERCQRFN